MKLERSFQPSQASLTSFRHTGEGAVDIPKNTLGPMKEPSCDFTQLGFDGGGGCPD